ncbi:DUF6318 family protein [Arthrobacter sp. A2-55]|uniref:DUF6318 family protein n=1 Tax=Arthrobacter sp. A2-55 TaxID=2897337 RepID=UPI0021CD844F|nr:DUF6318 family protein [Arthrobacter sp. A2-55]MCU6481123.1 DUF6318 family protein [Arthrobacter sp. A2-55]
MTTNMRTTARTVPFLVGRAGRLFVRPGRAGRLFVRPGRAGRLFVRPGRAGRLFVRPAGTARFRPSRPAAAVAAVVAAVVAASLLLTGCSSAAPPVAGSGSPGQSAPSTATAAATAAPTNPPTTVPAPAPAYKPATAAGPAQNVPVPVLPAKAKEFSKEGLEAFATYWYSTLGYAFETGDPGPMLAISDPGCKPCNAMKSAATGGHENGRWIVGGQMEVLTTEASFDPAPDGSYQTITMVRQSQVKYYRADKSLSKDLGAKSSVADIVVTDYVKGQWIAQTVEHLKGSSGE